MGKKNNDFNLKEAIKKLEDIEVALQSPDQDIDTSIAMHKEALILGKEILTYLKSAENVLEKLEFTENASSDDVAKGS